MKHKGLNERQRAFIRYKAEGLSNVQAYRKAGYTATGQSARSHAYQMKKQFEKQIEEQRKGLNEPPADYWLRNRATVAGERSGVGEYTGNNGAVDDYEPDPLNDLPEDIRQEIQQRNAKREHFAKRLSRNKAALRLHADYLDNRTADEVMDQLVEARKRGKMHYPLHLDETEESECQSMELWQLGIG